VSLRGDIEAVLAEIGSDIKKLDLSDSVGSIEASDGTPPQAPPADGKFHLWFNTNGVEA